MFRILITGILFFFICTDTSRSQHLAPGYTIQKWSIKDGLPVTAVNRIIQAQDGYLWLATSSGLVRFDGINFKVYSSANYPGLRGNRILNIVESSDGSILLQNQGSYIFALKDEKFKLLAAPNQGLVGEALASPFYKDKNGSIWLGDDTGIKVYKNNILEEFEPNLIHKPIERVYRAEDGIIWFTYLDSRALYRYEKGAIKKIFDLSADNTSNQSTTIMSLREYSNAIWFSTTSKIYSYKNETLTTEYETTRLIIDGLKVDKDNNLRVILIPENENNTHSLYTLKDGSLNKSDLPLLGLPRNPSNRNISSDWLITSKELYKNNQLIFTSDKSIEDFIVDSEGSLWITTLDDGLIQLKKNLFSTLSKKQGLPGNNMYSVLQTPDSSIWTGSFGSGVARILNDSVVQSGIDINGSTKGHVVTFEQLRDGSLLMGGLLSGLYSYDFKNESFEKYPASELVNNFSVHSIFEDSQQRLWIGTSPRGERGLFLRENNTWELIAGRNNVPYATYQHITEVSNGDIWMSARGEGLVRYDGHNYYHYSTKDGLNSDFIRAIYSYTNEENGEEVLLIGSEDNGIDYLTLDNGVPDFSTLTAINTTNGLYDNSIHVILEDDFKRIWMNTNQGVFWVEKSDIEALHNGDINFITSTSYTEEDGLLDREGNGGSQPAGIKAFDGTLWFPGQGGIASINPAEIQLNQTPPPLHIQQIFWENIEIPKAHGEVRLAADQRNFEITYAALSYLQPKKNTYRYKLEGFNKDWQEVGTRKTAYFTNVPFGKYTFTVQGSNNDGIWNTTGSSIAIIIAPYFYETMFFYLIIGLSLVGFILGGITLRERKARRKQAELEHIILERTEDLLKEKEEVEHQKTINDELSKAKDTFFTNISHELRTPLTLILGPLKNLVEDQQGIPDSWRRNLKLVKRNSYRLKQLVEQVLDLARMDSAKIELHPIKLNIGGKVKLITESFESLAESKKIKLRAHIPEGEVCAGVDSDKFQKILINLISNALKFTLANGSIDVQVKIIEDKLELSVSDTGIGIHKDRLPHVFNRFYSNEEGISGTNSGLGVGLNMTKEFVELHGGSISVDSELGKGTTFTVTLQSCVKTMESTDIATVDEEDILEYQVSETIIPMQKTNQNAETHILLVEDNEDMRSYISGLFSEDYISITEAKNGVEGKKKLALMKPDLIISDIMMPDMDGYEFTQYVRSLPEHRLTPIVILTALSDLENRLEALNLGVSDYLAKPFDEKELKVRIHNLLRLKTEREQARIIVENSEEELSEGAQFIKKLQDYIIENISNPKIRVEDLGDVINMSRRQLYRTLKAETGFTPAEFVKEIRLLRGRHIIENKTMTNISQISYAIGFSTPGYFTYIYEERFGVRPGSQLKG